MTEHQRALPFDDPRHLVAHHFLVEEAALLDAQLWDDWLELFTPDVRYVMPVRVSIAVADTTRSSLDDMAHFDEDLFSLRKRVERLATEHAWTEDPRSRTRHVVSNVRTLEGSTEQELGVESALLLLRSRGDDRPAELVSAGRSDVLRRTPDGWRLSRRHITIDEAVLRTQNLAIFL
ncbi:MAG: 3-phenylpropionate/cinnamic acid dioxygenase subunit beta [Actinomycetia bacterium]|nr:3-phenylpropionate/cinnamic acid dioxygenase subunit beta [Actinomycetes bacterium]